jgi:hypothetical protein
LIATNAQGLACSLLLTILNLTPPTSNSLFVWAENKRLKVPLTDLYERKTLLAG